MIRDIWGGGVHAEGSRPEDTFAKQAPTESVGREDRLRLSLPVPILLYNQTGT
jgi:hypothetical protein